MGKFHLKAVGIHLVFGVCLAEQAYHSVGSSTGPYLRRCLCVADRGSVNRIARLAFSGPTSLDQATNLCYHGERAAK